MRVELTIKSADNKQLTGVKVALNDQPLRATFDLNTGTFSQIAADRGTIAMNATSAGTLLTATAFILPGQRDITVTITATDGTTKQITLDANKNLKQGDKYTKKNQREKLRFDGDAGTYVYALDGDAYDHCAAIKGLQIYFSLFLGQRQAGEELQYVV